MHNFPDVFHIVFLLIELFLCIKYLIWLSAKLYNIRPLKVRLHVWRWRTPGEISVCECAVNWFVITVQKDYIRDNMIIYDDIIYNIR